MARSLCLLLPLAASLPFAAWAFQSAPSHDRRLASSSSQSSSRLSALPKEELIALAKDFLDNPSPEALADDYVFRGPVIGPLCKEDIAATLKSVGGDKRLAFPTSRRTRSGSRPTIPSSPTGFGTSSGPGGPSRGSRSSTRSWAT